jgi:hypothetical protein
MLADPAGAAKIASCATTGVTTTATEIAASAAIAPPATTAEIAATSEAAAPTAAEATSTATACQQIGRLRGQHQKRHQRDY